MAQLRIATWNLERPKKNALGKNAQRMEKIREIDADIWVLSETSSAIKLNPYFSLASESQTGYHAEGECFVAIGSRWPIVRSIETFDPFFAICAEICTPVGPMIVFGSIITYANDRGPDVKSRRWEEHRKSIKSHAADWRRLRKAFPNHLFCAAGDFNQSRDGSGWYEDAQSVMELTSALKNASLKCVTEADMRANGQLQSRASVDHICLSDPLAAQMLAVRAWEGRTPDGCRLSDHNGIVIDIDIGQ